MNHRNADTLSSLTEKQGTVDVRLDELIEIAEQTWCAHLPPEFRVAQTMSWLTDIDHNIEATRLLLATAIDRLRTDRTDDTTTDESEEPNLTTIAENAVRAIVDDIAHGAIKLPCPVRVSATVIELGSGTGIDIDLAGLPDGWATTTTRRGYFTHEAASEQGKRLGQQIVSYFPKRGTPPLCVLRRRPRQQRPRARLRNLLTTEQQRSNPPRPHQRPATRRRTGQ